MSKLKIIDKPSEVEELIHYCKQTKTCSFDYETSSLEYQNPNEYPLIMGVSFQPGSSWILPLGHKNSPFKKTYVKHLKFFGKEVLEDPEINKVAWNLKFEDKWSMRYGIKANGRLFDGMLAKYCLDEEKPNDLKSFVQKHFPKYAHYEDDLDGAKGKKKIPWPDKDFIKLCTYCGIDSDLTGRGMIFMEPKLIRLNFYNLFRNLLMMASRVLAESEYRGILIHRSYLEDLMATYKIKISDSDSNLRNNRKVLKYEKKYKRYHLKKLIEEVNLDIEEIESDAPKNAEVLIRNRLKKIDNFNQGVFSKKDRYDKINFGSPPQLEKFLFSSKFGLRLDPVKQTDKGANSTDEETLEELKQYDDSGFMDQLLIHRGLQKLDSTYISGIHPLLDLQDRVHAGFKIPGTVTGRLSCADPNLQNIPRDTVASDIKRMFTPPPGYLLLEVDYGQAELRVVAELARDKAMIDIFKRNYNIHVATACKVNNCLEKYDEIKAIIKRGDAMDGEELKKPENKNILFWLKQKKRAKTINFGILYGQTEKKLSIELECTEREAKKVIKDWFAAYPGVRRWMARMKKDVHKNGYVMSLFGRKRRLYDIDSHEYWRMLEAERQAINSPIQGTASDFGLFSSVIIREKILKGILPIDMQMVYTVHDSLGFYIRPYDIHRVVPELRKICNNPSTLKYFGFKLKHVEMKISVEVGEGWGMLNEYSETQDYVKFYKNLCKN